MMTQPSPPLPDMSPAAIDLFAEFIALTDALSAAGVPFAVCGGIAVAIHGYQRYTRDIDLLVLPEDEQRVRAVAEQQQYLFEGGRIPMVGSDGKTEWEIVRVTKIIGRDALPLDLLLVGESIRLAWDTRGEVNYSGRRIPFVSREGLKLLKKSAGRKQDLLDLEQLGLE